MSIPTPLDDGQHPLLWPRLPADAVVGATPSTVEEALGMMERSHAATLARLRDEPVTDGETVPLSHAWFAAVREACARTGPVPGVERYLLEWWVTDPPAEELSQLPWLFGVWQGRWVCWAGTTPWAAADQRVTTAWDRAAFEQAVRFGAEPEHPPTEPWTTLGTSALAVPTVILLALAGKPATGAVRMPVTPTPAAEPEPTTSGPETAPVAGGPSADVLEGRIPPPPGAPGAAEGPTEPTGAEAESEPETTEALPIETAAAETTEALPIETTALEPGTTEALPVETAAEPVAAPVETEPVAPIEAPATGLPPASWYPDPSGRHQLRYWDGQRWTEHAADQATGQVIDPL